MEVFEMTQELSTTERINTTVGDLIEAIAQIALEASGTEEEGYALATLAMENILRKNRIRHIRTSA